MEIAICSFSFHRLLAAGKQDIFQYIKDCKMLDCTQLDPWNAHLADVKKGDEVLHAGHNPGASQHLTAVEDDYITRVRQAADAAGLPFGCIAVDGAHIYEADLQKRAANRQRAYRWLDVAHKLGAKQVRIDAGGPENLPDEALAVIKEGYRDLIDRGQKLGVEILIENHWGPARNPDNVMKILENVPGLGLLHDAHNWMPERRREAWPRFIKYTRETHIKSFNFDDQGNEITPGEDVADFITLYRDAGYKGTWGVESVPKDGNEIEGARQTIALIRRIVAAK